MTRKRYHYSLGIRNFENGKIIDFQTLNLAFFEFWPDKGI